MCPFAKDEVVELTTFTGLYQEGDFIANFHGCQRETARTCEEEMGPLIARWRELKDQEGRQ